MRSSHGLEPCSCLRPHGLWREGCQVWVTEQGGASGQKWNKTERTLSGDYNQEPNQLTLQDLVHFQWLQPLSQLYIFPGQTDRQASSLHHPKFTAHTPISPCVWSLPWVICKQWAHGSCGECEAVVSWWSCPDGHVYTVWPPLRFLPIINVNYQLIMTIAGLLY